MNIFYTNPDPIQCAREHCITHINKMATEYSQILSTAHRVLDGTPREVIYKGSFNTYGILPGDQFRKDHLVKPICMMDTHIDHPSNTWVRVSIDHYRWLLECLKELQYLYHGYKGKAHGSSWCLDFISNTPRNIPDKGWVSDPYLAINPELYPKVIKFWEESKDVPLTYQKYMRAKYREWMYRTDKRQMIPQWYDTPPNWINY